MLETKIKEITERHREAMQCSDYAEIAKSNGDQEKYLFYTTKALNLEAEAALLTENDYSFEPSRSVLFRSAATFALEAKDYRFAERLIGNALSGNPPAEIAEELRDLLEDVYFYRHLEVKGVELQQGEVQMSLAGKSVGHGIAQSDDFVQRIKDFETLLYRTAERHLNKEFRDAGRRQKDLSEKIDIYVSTPRAASFAVTLKIGNSNQYEFPEISFSENIMSDLLDGIELISKGDIDGLTMKIPQEDYRLNFIGLTEKIAPDGENIKTVAFTRIVNGEKRFVSLTKSKKEIREKTKKTIPEKKSIEKEIEIKGTLLSADAKKINKGEIEIFDSNNKSHKISVPRGMMSDIVKPYFEEFVIVSVLCKENGIMELRTIDLAEAPDVE